ncbi:MAG: single-stranded-DNA-specific exonuclease RecJ [Candidatus Poribacteria bacterium]|nr:single-stranded-DNA-specific exonuclease RecJ [Candidatus Poribacteria bacterium]
MKSKIWRVQTPDIEKSSRLAVRLGISQLVAQLLVNRGIETEDAAHAYLYPTAADLHSPFLMYGMEKAVDRIHSAMKRGEKIWIFGDYDTDGTTAASLLLNTFRHLDYPVQPYIPHRFNEGYGLNAAAIRKLKEDGCDLLITVDCGITSINEVKVANEVGVDVIITDHHQPPPDALPPAYAVITPRMPESEYPFDGLAGVGLAFKLAHGLMEGGEINPFLQSQLDLVALGTVVDIATLKGENRVLTRLGLAEINKRERPGIRALCDVADYPANKPIAGYTLSYVLGPRINAAGRMDAASKVVQLLTTDAYETAMPIAQELDTHNRERREVEKRIQEQAISKIEKNVKLDETKGLVVAHKDWHRGVVGIVASRILEKYYRPVFLLAIDGDDAHGSGRGIDGINLAASLNACTDLLVKHGGHEAAAGLTIKTENIPKFAAHFNRYACEHLSDEDLVSKLSIDLEVQMPYLTLDTIDQLHLLEPFGADNSPPRLSIRNLSLQRSPDLIGKDKNHLKLFVTDGRQTMEALGWYMSDHLIALKNKNIRLDLAFEPEINEWNNTRRLQLKIEDLRIRTLDRHSLQSVFPAADMASPAKIVDRRNVRSKQNYLDNLLDRREPTLLYVRDEKALDQLLELIGSKRRIGRCGPDTSEDEKQRMVDELAKQELQTIAASCSLANLPHVAHIVFCHPIPQPLHFFNRCQPAFKHPETTYIHLIYNPQDVEWMQKCVFWQYPDERTLRKLYKKLKVLSQGNGHRLGFEAMMAEIQADSIPELAIRNGLSILQELQLISQHVDAATHEIQLLPPPPKKRQLQESETYLNGEQIKLESQLFSDFQLKQNIEQIWERVSYECRIPD